MFCVVQEIQLKRPSLGDYKEYKVMSTSFTIDGTTRTHYSWYPNHEAGRFERPCRTSYRISIHESYRKNGRVKKKQCVVGSISYYSLIEFGLYDSIDTGLKHAAELFHADYDTLYDLVENKMDPILERIRQEFQQTEEYKVVQERDALQKRHAEAKRTFEKKYGVDEYEYCYNIFGELMEPEYLKQIQAQYRAQQAYSRSYQGYQRNTYSSYSGGSYQSIGCKTYTDDEKRILKKCYKKLSMAFHPDLNLGSDTTEEMQMINKLKEEWGI